VPKRTYTSCVLNSIFLDHAGLHFGADFVDDAAHLAAHEKHLLFCESRANGFQFCLFVFQYCTHFLLLLQKNTGWGWVGGKTQAIMPRVQNRLAGQAMVFRAGF
jgi:hypothetical protein